MKRLKQNPHADLIAWANGQREDSPQKGKANCPCCHGEGFLRALNGPVACPECTPQTTAATDGGVTK